MGGIPGMTTPAGPSSPASMSGPAYGAAHRWERIVPPKPHRRRGSVGVGGGGSAAGADRDRVEWPQARSGHACAVAGNLVFFFGGRHRQGRFNDVFVLNTGARGCCGDVACCIAVLCGQGHRRRCYWRGAVCASRLQVA